MKMQADIPLSELGDAGALYDLLDAYADNHGTRVIPREAQMSVVLTSVGGERMDPVRQVPSTLRFTWEV